MPPQIVTSSRNVVTWSDLDLVGTASYTSPSSGHIDAHGSHPQQASMSPHLGSQCMQLASVPGWQAVDDRPWERILAVPSPQQVAVSSAMGSHFQLPPPRPHSLHQHMQPMLPQGAAWSSETDAAMRQWLAASQFAAPAVYPTHACGATGMPLTTAHAIPSSIPCATVSPPSPLAAATACMGVAAVTPLTTSPVEAAPVQQEQPKVEAVSDSEKLETLLQSLAADTYQD